MIHLKSITVAEGATKGNEEFPFNVPVLRSLRTIAFDSAVTFLVGENGAGKSTLLEAIACAVGAITVGSESVTTDKTLDAVRKFSRCFRLTWTKRTHRGFFLRAEDFFGYAKTIASMREDFDAEIKTIEEKYKDRSQLARTLAKAPLLKERGALKERYGESLDGYSHGESFLTLFKSRFVPNGLYLLDEPEAPLSPLRQLAFISALKAMVEQDSQFIISTHSPMIMAFPGATIMSLEAGSIRNVRYDDLEHVNLTKSFLNNPDAYLKNL
jgi:predicted ATPase